VVSSSRTFNSYAEFGINPNRMVLIRVFARSHDRQICTTKKNDTWVVAARLSPEKGVQKLVEQWPDDIKLDIYGEGREKKSIESMRKPTIRLMGQVSQGELARALPSYVGLVLPSLWRENLPNVVLMALEADLPIVAREGSSASDIVREFAVGSIYESDAVTLAASLHAVSDLHAASKMRPKQVFRTNFAEEVWLENASNLIDSLMEVRVG
jgi:glycosyltransferase involved in cell wall biosynthesis